MKCTLCNKENSQFIEGMNGEISEMFSISDVSRGFCMKCNCCNTAYVNVCGKCSGRNIGLRRQEFIEKVFNIHNEIHYQINIA